LQSASQLVPGTQFSSPSVLASGRPQNHSELGNNQSQVQEVAMQQGEKITCSFITCPGYPFKPVLKCVVYHADIHSACVNVVIQGQQAASGNSYCSPQCTRYFNDDNISHDVHILPGRCQ
jgi:hypothetical protein